VTPNGTALRALRKVHGWTLRDLARHTGLSHPYLSRLERERAMASEEVIGRIAQAYQVPPDDITRGDPVSVDTTTAPPPQTLPNPGTEEGAYHHYTPEQAAMFLPLTARTLRERAYKRLIPFSEITHGIRFTGLDIREIAETYRVRPTDTAARRPARRRKAS
jgi:transcriptional regulator with XRE-family HTH domain